jgi:hypothetical protein
MAKVKYRIREFQPTANQTGGHSFYAEAVIDNVITNKELAKKIEARGISRAAEIKSILEEAANIIYEECLENNRVQLESEGGALVSIYPSCSGSVSDKDVVANPDKYEGTVATADMVTPDIIKWTLGASIGRKFAQQFAANKQAQRVDYNPNQQTADPEPNNGGNNNGGGTLVDDPDGD